MINSKLDPEILGKIKAIPNKNFLLENIKKSKQSPEKKRIEEGKYADRTLINTLSKAELSKTTINMYSNKDISYLKAGANRKSEKLDPLVLNSYKLKTTSDGFK